MGKLFRRVSITMAVATTGPNLTYGSSTAQPYYSQTYKKRMHASANADDLEKGSWTLRIQVVLEADCSGNTNLINGAAAEEFGEDVIVKNMRVLGDMHIGRLQADLVKSLNSDLPQIDLSEHKFWWPDQRQWLTKARYTLDQYGLNAESIIEFKTSRRPLVVQLPDLQLRPMFVDFSATVFRVVIQICKDLKLRHPEELSLMLLVSRENQRLLVSQQQQDQSRRQKPKRHSDNENGSVLSPMSPMGTLGGEPRWTVSPTQTLNSRAFGKTPSGTMSSRYGGPATSGLSSSTTPYSTFRRDAPSSVVSPSSYYSSTMPRPSAFDSTATATSTLIRSRNGATFEAYNPLQDLISTPAISFTEAAQRLTTSRPRNVVDKAFANACWLDSSKSLLEQGVDKGFRVMLRFKFFSFFDLKPTKPNLVRLNQLYEHAKWCVLGEETEATDEEAFSFAGLQYQIRTRQALDTSSSEDLLSNSGSGRTNDIHGVTSPRSPVVPSITVTSQPTNADDVDAAITQLQVQLETGISTRGPAVYQRTHSPRHAGSKSPANGQENLREIPELKDFLKISRKSKFGLNKFSSSSPYYLILRDLQLSIYRSKEDANSPTTPAVEMLKLVGCEVQALARSGSDRKLNIRLFVPYSEGMREIVLKCKNIGQYAAWLAAFRLASKGKTMADSSYDTEVQCVQSSLASPQRNGSRSGLVISSPMTTADGSRTMNKPPVELNIAEYLPQSVSRRYKQKDVINRILEAHSRVSALSTTEAKISYIRQWEALPNFDVSYFLVRVVQVGSQIIPQPAKQSNSFEYCEVIGVTPNKLIRYDSPKTMSIINVLSFEHITSWKVDWERRVVSVDSDAGVLAFSCASCDCKVFHELLGGYIFMSLRSSAQNKQLDEEMFQKLTGGRE